MTRHEINIEADMLQGNINRMFMTKEEKELYSMRDYAKRRIDMIFDWKMEQLQEDKVNQKTEI